MSIIRQGMPTLYDVIGDLRRENPTPNACRTLDLVVAELGNTRDNLRLALLHLESREVPTGGQPLLHTLAERARAAGVDDLDVPLPRHQVRRRRIYEAIDGSQIGIAALLGGSALLLVLLAAAVVVAGVQAALKGQ